MSVKKREYSGHFAMLDIDFILGDPRLNIPDSAFRLYITLWLLAVRERSEVLPGYYYPPSKRSKIGFSVTSLAHQARVDFRSVPSGINKLSEAGLIDVKATGEITVCGVKEKHPNLKWKDSPNQTNSGNFEFDYKESETETETEISPAARRACHCSDNKFENEIKRIYDFYIEHSKRDPFRYKLTPHRKQKIQARLAEGFDLPRMTAAIQAVLNNPWNMGENPQGRKYIELEEHIFRSYEQTEKRVREFEEKYGKID